MTQAEIEAFLIRLADRGRRHEWPGRIWDERTAGWRSIETVYLPGDEPRPATTGAVAGLGEGEVERG